MAHGGKEKSLLWFADKDDPFYFYYLLKNYSQWTSGLNPALASVPFSGTRHQGDAVLRLPLLVPGYGLRATAARP
jgi:hypothetical protein